MIIMPRFFVDQQPQDGVLTLTGENAHHAGRVLRLRVGEGVTLCDGAGMDFDCTVEAVEKEAVTCRVVSCHAADTEPKQSITLFMALPKGDKMEFIVQKAVELGVSRIVPYLSKNCVSRPDKTEKKVERWRKIAGSKAVRQRTSAGGGSRCTGCSGNRAGGGKRNGTVFLRKREADRSARCACRRCQGHGFADGRAGGRLRSG